MPGSCSSGFRSRPSAAGGNSRSNGFDVSSMNSRKPERDEAHHAEHARDHLVGQVAALERDRHRPAAEHQHPEQHRAFVRAPRRGDPVLQRQLRVRVGRDVEHREVVGDERVREAAERERDEQELSRRERPRERHPRGNAPLRADERQRALQRASSSARMRAKCPSSGIMACSFASRLQRLRGLFHRGARLAPGRPRAAASGGM